jgi:hypothetical protein
MRRARLRTSIDPRPYFTRRRSAWRKDERGTGGYGSSKTVPTFVPTPRIEALPAIARPGARKARKPLKTRDISQCFAKLLCCR